MARLKGTKSHAFKVHKPYLRNDMLELLKKWKYFCEKIINAGCDGCKDRKTCKEMLRRLGL